MANWNIINLDIPTNPQNVPLDKYESQMYNFQASPYKDLINGESSSVTQAKEALANELSNKPSYNNNYQDKIQDAIDYLSSNKPTDISGLQNNIYSEYGKNLSKAKSDTIAQALNLAGGYNGGNSIQAVADQIYQQGLANRDDVVPQLLELAYQKQQNDKNNAYNLLNAYNNLEQTDYGKYRDNMSDYQRALQNATDMLMRQEQKSRDIFNTDRAFNESAWESRKALEQSAFEALQNRKQEQVQNDNSNKLKINQQQWNNYLDVQNLNNKDKANAFTEDWNNYKMWQEEQDRIAAERAAAARAAAQSSSSSRSSSKSSDDEPLAKYDYSQLANSQGVNEFKKNVMTRDEFNRRTARTGAYNGYNTYSEYIMDKLDSYKYGTGDTKYKLSDGEKLYLLDRFGIK